MGLSVGLDKPTAGPGFFGWPIKAQARRPLLQTLQWIRDPRISATKAEATLAHYQIFCLVR